MFINFPKKTSLTSSTRPTIQLVQSPTSYAVFSLLLSIITCFTTDIRAAETDPFTKTIKPAIQKHCAKCHGTGGNAEGEIDLLKLQNSSDLSQNAKLVRKLIDVLDLKEMPPEDEPELEPKLRQQLIAQLKTVLHATVSKKKAFAHTPIRRMNRFQYNNAVTDLFQLKCVVFTLPERMLREHDNYFQPATGKMPKNLKVGSRPLGKSQMIETRLAGVAAFPQDLRAEHGFDNRGDHLSLSPLLLESFLTLSRSIVHSPDFNPKNCGIWNSFFSEPDPESDLPTQVRTRLRPFLTHAFRQPVEEKQLKRYSDYALAQIHSGKSFTRSMQDVAAATIASPKFFYLYNRTGVSEVAEPLDNFELASRLSFFLWGSIPDQTLLDLAQTGKLTDREVLSNQVDRMLNDRKLKRFCDSFPAQWLQLERIISSAPDRKHYPEFYFSKYRNSMHMMLEPLLLFEAILIENRSILQLIDSDFSYRSARLDNISYRAKRTGQKDTVTTLPFERVILTDRRQGGIITNAAVMTMTSGPERTQPITRGAWIATVIFNNPPEPPPANVPPLTEEAPKAEVYLTLRERLAAHRERADCAGCHEKIDPLGFALENYGPTGKWRDVYKNGRKVDMQGTLFRKHKFNNIVEFKDAILAEKDRFTRGLAAHLLSFALARETGVADTVALDKITRNTASDDYRIQTLIKQVVLSDPFLHKSNAKTAKQAEVERAIKTPGEN
ncbi:DUF1592 domain-containing protein [uncultured Gimesia sp.]|uniref:DUF1592 domain-containing protein n=1 Tax=uncultured Gimesia sp. TaxID=1678688 RepID=UPI0026161138|nr:DUF1592 domain-containing protein [uncultured Gimesia sp.]